MSCYLQNPGAGTLAQRRSGRAWLHDIADRMANRMRAALDRRRQRQELLDYLASDHRAAADLGISGYEARSMSQRPFRRDLQY
jgi:hypothetical protein